ncbi:MAG: hypothetical protein IKX55_00040 [Bacteroidaceae bacterium]|nr:hypothetical protein [Bacteroidaceae bacterium]
MKRLFFSVLALTLGSFVFWSCDNEDEIDNGKGKPAERGSFMTVQQQRDAFQDNLNGIVEAIDFSELSQAAEVVAQAVGKKWSFMSVMPIFSDSVLAQDSLFLQKLQFVASLATKNYESMESIDLDLRPLYMEADVHVVDTVLYGDTIAAVLVENVKHDVDHLLLNVFIEGHTVSLKAKVEPGESSLDYTNVDKQINAHFALPEIAEITVSLDGKVLADVKGELKTDYSVSVTNDEEKSFVIEGTKLSAKGNVKVAGYELNGIFNFDIATGANASLSAKYGTTELLSVNGKLDATFEGVDLADSAQVLAWAQNPDKLKSISLDASLRGGKVEFKLNAFNPFKDDELAKILRSQMLPGAKLTEEQEAKMVERLNEVIDGGFYFEGFKDPQAKLKFVYREIADEAKPVTDNEKITGLVGADVVDAVSETIFKGGAYTMLVVHDDEGYEKEIQLEEYFAGINTEALTQALMQKVLQAFGPVIAQFSTDDEE